MLVFILILKNTIAFDFKKKKYFERRKEEKNMVELRQREL